MNVEQVPPSTLNEAVDLIINGIPEEQRKTVIDQGFPHHGFGTSIRNNWNLWWTPQLAKQYPSWGQEEPSLVADLSAMGFYHGDDRSGAINAAVMAKLVGNDVVQALKDVQERYIRHWYDSDVDMELGNEFAGGKKPPTVDQYITDYRSKFPIDVQS